MDWNDYLAKRDSTPKGTRKYLKIYEAWKQYYPTLTGPEIAAKIGLPVGAAENFMVELNATDGNFDKALLRHRSYSVRARLRRVIRFQPDHPNIVEIVNEEARITKLMADLKISSAEEQIEKRIDAVRKEAEWAASGIDG